MEKNMEVVTSSNGQLGNVVLEVPENVQQVATNSSNYCLFINKPNISKGMVGVGAVGLGTAIGLAAGALAPTTVLLSITMVSVSLMFGSYFLRYHGYTANGDTTSLLGNVNISQDILPLPSYENIAPQSRLQEEGLPPAYDTLKFKSEDIQSQNELSQADDVLMVAELQNELSSACDNADIQSQNELPSQKRNGSMGL